MRATTIHGTRDIRLSDVADPTLEAPTDAIVKVVAACICGSDLWPYRGENDITPGDTIGHECVGIVEEAGAEVTSFRPGDFVIVPFAYSDNTCAFCRDGFQTSCVHGGFYGSRGVGGLQAEFARIPQADGTLVVVPGVDESSELLPSLLTLSDVYLTGCHAAHMGRVSPGQTVTVIGDGAVGLSAVLAAKQLGAERIILMGRHTSRIAKVMDLTGGEGSHVVLEAVGHMPAYAQSYGIVRPGGVISRVGVPQYEEAPVGFGSLFGKNVTLTGGPAPVRAYLEPAIQQVLAGEINPGRVFDRTVAIDDVPSGYAAMDAREALKVMVSF